MSSLLKCWMVQRYIYLTDINIAKTAGEKSDP